MNLKEKLKKFRVPVDDINRFLAYVEGEKHKEQDKDYKPVTNNTDEMLYTMFVKFWKLGLAIDGVNVVITGKAMAMVTFHGYKNKVLQNYPSAKFDVQLVRNGDEFKVSKKDGAISYTHDIANPFGSDPIIGAYCVITIDDKGYFEALNERDFNFMKGGSKQSSLWQKWDSEFWLKSVIKRACKRHFYDVVKEVDEVDNEDYGQNEKPKEVIDEDELVDAIGDIGQAETLEELKEMFMSSRFVNQKRYVAAKDKRKKELMDASA